MAITQNGSYTITARVEDMHGNTAIKTGFFNVGANQNIIEFIGGPNPFNPTDSDFYFSYNISDPVQEVKIIIVNQLGDKIWDYVATNNLPGYFLVPWNGKTLTGKSVTNGIYHSFAIFKTNTKTTTKKFNIAILKE